MVSTDPLAGHSSPRTCCSQRGRCSRQVLTIWLVGITVVWHQSVQKEMTNTLLSLVRRRRHRLTLAFGVVLVLSAWLSFSFAPFCTRPMVQHPVQDAASCPLEIGGQHSDPRPRPSLDDCTFKACLDDPSDRWTQVDVKDPTPTAWIVILPLLIGLFLPLSPGHCFCWDRRRRHPRSVPLIYQFCSLLN